MDDSDTPSFELREVPFFPQARYQCGPAALATVLTASDVAVVPETLIADVYLPDRQGSLQVEIKAAARRYGRIPYEIDPTLQALFTEAAAGRPVLVLQNLAFGWLPRWHYAVLVGYDAAQHRVVLRSGRTARRLEPLSRFQRSWALADHWAMVLLKPGEIPATGSANRYLRAIVESGSVLPIAVVSKALQTGAENWPGNADLHFALANELRHLERVVEAAAHYRSAIDIEPDHAGALNNFADLLFTEDCLTAAATYAARASQAVLPDSPMAAVVEATVRETALAPSVPGIQNSSATEHCRFLTR